MPDDDLELDRRAEGDGALARQAEVLDRAGALRDIATNRRLRQPAMPGAAVAVTETWERK